MEEGMSLGEALFKIRGFLEERGADAETLTAWCAIRDGITKMIGEMMQLHTEKEGEK